MQSSYSKGQLDIDLHILNRVNLGLPRITQTNAVTTAELYDQIILGNLSIKWGPYLAEELFAMTKDGDNYLLESGLPISITAENKIIIDPGFIADLKIPGGSPTSVTEGLDYVFSKLIASL